MRTDDYRRVASERLPADVWDFIEGGSGDELTLAALAALVLLGLLVATWKGLRNAEATLKALESARPARRRTRNAGRKPADQNAGTPAEASKG